MRSSAGPSIKDKVLLLSINNLRIFLIHEGRRNCAEHGLSPAAEERLQRCRRSAELISSFVRGQQAEGLIGTQDTARVASSLQVP